MRAAILLSLLLLILSCGHRKRHRSNAGVRSDTGEMVVDLKGNFYKRYTGTIAGKPVVVHIHKYGSELQGVYYYASVGQDILLRNWSDTVTPAGTYLLHEIAPEDMQEQNGPGASWTLSIAQNTATGTWRNADGTQQYPIALKEEYPGGSLRLDALWMADSAALWPDKPQSPVAKASYGFVLPQEENGDFLYDVLRQQIAPNTATPDEPEEAVRSAMTTYFNSYRVENKDLHLDPASGLEAFSFNYTDDKEVYVHYNDDNWLVTELFDAYYTGGAHGNYSSSYTNIDLEQQRVWKLADMVTDTTALRPLLNDAAIAYFNLKPGEGMRQRLLTDEVSATENVYLGPKGLSFVYNPYEIASYADGQVTLFIPYQKLFNLLTPAFKERMKLSGQSGVAMRPLPRKNLSTYASRRTITRKSPLSYRPLPAARHL